jgi:hypothetical protein
MSTYPIVIPSWAHGDIKHDCPTCGIITYVKPLFYRYEIDICDICLENYLYLSGIREKKSMKTNVKNSYHGSLLKYICFSHKCDSQLCNSCGYLFCKAHIIEHISKCEKHKE